MGTASRARRILVLALVPALAATAVWIGGSYVAERVLFHPARTAVGPPPSTLGWGYEDVSFRDRAGLVLRGWWVPGAGAAAPTIVMAHGWTSSRRQPYAKSAYLHAAGYNLLLFDFRGHGESDGDYTTLGWAEPDDLRAALDYASSRARGPLGVIGYSMGAAVALEEAATDPRVKAVVADSPYADLAAEERWAWQTWARSPLVPFAVPLDVMSRVDLGYHPERTRPEAAAALLQRPLLVISGTADRVVPPAQEVAVYSAASPPKQLLVVPGADHTGAYDRDPTTYEHTVLTFLSPALAQPPPPS